MIRAKSGAEMREIMKSFVSLMKADLCRAILSFNFIASVIVILLVMLISCSGFINATSDVTYLLGHALTGSGSTLFILCIAPILPYGMSYASDVEDKALTFWIIRTGTTRYAISKFITAVIAGFMAVGVSIAVFSLILSMFFPMFNQISSGDSYAVLLKSNEPVVYILAIAVHYALSAALFAGAAMTVSTFISNKFSVVAAPLVIYFVLLRLTDLADLPYFLKAGFLVQNIYSRVSPLAAFLYKLIPVIIILGIFLSVTMKQMKKRMG